MSNNVQLTQTVDQREVVQALQQQAALIDKATQRLDQMGKKGEQAGRQGSASFGGMARNVAAVGQELFGVGSALDAVKNTMALLRSEYEQIQAGRAQANATQTTIAQKQRAAALNFGVKDAELMNRFADEIVAKSGAEKGAVLDALSAGASFKGTRSLEDVRDAVLASAMLDPNDAAGLITSTKGNLTQMKAGGGTAEEIAGFQMRLKQSSPVVTNQDFANNLAPGLGNLIQSGVSAQESAALLALLGHATGDATGAMTRTSSVQLVNQLKRFVPQANTLEEQISAIQENPALRKELLGALDPSFSAGLTEEQKSQILSGDLSGVPKMNLTGEAQSLPAFVSLLSDPKELQKFRQFKQDVGTLEGSDKFFNDSITAINQLPEQVAQAQRNQMAGQVRQAELQNPGALSADVQKRFDEALIQAGYGSASRLYELGEVPYLADAAYALSNVGLSATQTDDIKYREGQLRSIAQNERDAGRLIQAEQLTKLADQFAATAEVVARLEQTIAQQNALQAEANAKLQQNTDVTAQNTRQNQANPVEGQQRGTP